jgi:hypothetical protein
MGVDKWMDTNNISVKTMWGLCMTCSWGVGSFCDLMHTWFALDIILIVKDVITSSKNYFSMYGVWRNLGTYILIITFVNYGVKLPMDFGFDWPIELDTST